MNLELSLELWLVIGMSLILLGLMIVGYFLWKQMGGQVPPELQQLLESVQRDKEDRYREQESLKQELRESSKGLREEFYRVNKTVDHKLSESSKQLNERLDKSSTVIGSLQKELGKMGEIGTKIESLDKILRAPKGRGSMGEESLEEILRSVFPANLWDNQYVLGPGLQVDAVVKTSNGLIPIDAKFPLTGFEKLLSAENDEAILAAKKEFESDVKKRINETAKYIRPEAETLNFAILYLPSENIYYEAAIRSNEIAKYAKSKNVLLTGPNTMLYVLQMLFQAYQSQEFAKQAQAALAQLSGVKVQAGKLDEAVRLTATHLGRANSQIAAVQTENDKLQNQIEKVSSLDVGKEEVKSKSEPEQLL